MYPITIPVKIQCNIEVICVCSKVADDNLKENWKINLLPHWLPFVSPQADTQDKMMFACTDRVSNLWNLGYNLSPTSPRVGGRDQPLTAVKLLYYYLLQLAPVAALSFMWPHPLDTPSTVIPPLFISLSDENPWKVMKGITVDAGWCRRVHARNPGTCWVIILRCRKRRGGQNRINGKRMCFVSFCCGGAGAKLNKVAQWTLRLGDRWHAEGAARHLPRKGHSLGIKSIGSHWILEALYSFNWKKLWGQHFHWPILKIR